MAEHAQHDDNQQDDNNYDVLIESSVLAVSIELSYTSKSVADEVAESVLTAAERRGTVRVPFTRSEVGGLVDEGTLVLDFAAAATTRVKVSQSPGDVGNQPSTVRR